MNIYDRINEVRKSKGVKWKYLNEKIPGAYSSRMTELKNGKTTLSEQQLGIIADILGTTTDYLLGKTNDPAPIGQKEAPAENIYKGANPPLYDLLTPENQAKVDSYLEFLLAEQQNGQS